MAEPTISWNNASLADTAGPDRRLARVAREHGAGRHPGNPSPAIDCASIISAISADP